MNLRPVAAMAVGLMLVGGVARADQITDYRVAISSSSNGSLEIRTTTVFNGDQAENHKVVLHPESIIDYECDAHWTCNEGKGSQRYSYLAFPKSKGWGYLLVKVFQGYESEQWAGVWMVGTDGRRVAPKDLKLGCQDFYWTNDGSKLVVVEGATATAYEPMRGRAVGAVPMENAKDWIPIAKRRCGFEGGE